MTPTNRIQALLDTLGLPWRESMATLAARYGVQPDTWLRSRIPVVLLGLEQPPLPGLLRPLLFQMDPDHDASLPPASFMGYIWAGKRVSLLPRDWARQSLELARQALEPALGEPRPDDTSNTYGWRWQFGPSQISIACFPPLLQQWGGRNSVHEAEPRTKTACHITIQTGYRPPCSAAERAAVAAFVPALPLGGAYDPAIVATRPLSQYALDYVRAPVPGFARAVGQIGRSPDGQLLIFATSELRIVPVADVLAVDVERILPARGSGGAHVRLACARDGGRPRHIELYGQYGVPADSLNDAGQRIADWIGTPCILGAYHLDD
ncbi:hypothetical protein [Sphingomonas sanxanigenens]|uniref:Uncharacterized protein n=1 Tax=Sphingomonas sanxanigenens DSM 19645 = NX02 TaxID=1123269 RepID=W0A706_9SPHN|nr:hypothetical protein [Sphingomonas sanxanigenens]AHE52881.1 hypothetical protein NX02_05725 [Sphingomonas sanxanigenens DSM 19645 = NX02]